ncbi:Obox6 [Phodopus roborovskii]|uniref:Obox6 protein n=1 Tax=Phodopus roborovskii TaxID=109678 RepID=A0AAV0AB40_PHORO|nr:Obox6 [Phodopus roborovskii]
MFPCSYRTPTNPNMESHQIHATHQNLQMSQSPLVAATKSTESTLQRYPDPERYMYPQVSPGPSTQRNPHQDSSLQMYSVLPAEGTHPNDAGFQVSSCSSGSCSVRDSQESLENINPRGYQEVPPNRPERQKKIRISYSKHQKQVLQENFDKRMYPNLEERVKLAEMIGVTEQQIQVWFKNHRVKYRRNNLLSMQETTGNSTVDCGSATSHDNLTGLASTNGESVSAGSSGLGPIPNLSPRLESSHQSDQASESARYTPKGNMLDFESPGSAAHLGLPEENEVPSDPAQATGAASSEAPLLMAAAAQGPEHAQDSGPSAEELWQRVLEDFGY